MNDKITGGIPLIYLLTQQKYFDQGQQKQHGGCVYIINDILH